MKCKHTWKYITSNAYWCTKCGGIRQTDYYKQKVKHRYLFLENND